MVMTDNEALNKIVELLKDIKKLEKGMFTNEQAANAELSKPE